MLAARRPSAAPTEAPQLPPELSDPAMADKLGKMAGALTRALMDMPVGELEAAIAGPRADPGRPRRRVRDEIGGPDAEREVEAQVAASGRQMQAMSKALVASLPSIMACAGGGRAGTRARQPPTCPTRPTRSGNRPSS